jgi:hypothetical protein
MSMSVTIDNLSPVVLDRLQVEAQRRGVDVKAVVKELIESGLGPAAADNTAQVHHDLDELAGTWTSQEADKFLADVATMRQCDEDLWQ